MRRYALVLLLMTACTQEKALDPYERAVACEDIVSEAHACRLYITINADELIELNKSAGGKKPTAEQSAKYAQLKEEIEEAGDCNRLKVRVCELFWRILLLGGCSRCCSFSRMWTVDYYALVGGHGRASFVTPFILEGRWPSLTQRFSRFPALLVSALGTPKR